MELKQAIEIIKKEVVRSGGKYSVLQKCEAFDTLISLAEKVLEIGGKMPTHIGIAGIDDSIWNDSYNLAIDQCTLAGTGLLAEKDKKIANLEKECDRLKEIIEPLDSENIKKDKKIAELESDLAESLDLNTSQARKISELERQIKRMKSPLNGICKGEK